MPDVTSILQQAIEHYKPGGEFATVRGRQLEEKRGKFTATAESRLAGRGLAGTTVGAAIPAAFEQQIATPWRTETEMFRGARLMEAILGQAGFAEREAARQQEAEIAKAQMELQERLANKQISVQEYNAATARLRTTAGGMSPSEQFYARSAAETAAFGKEDKADTGVAGGDAGYGRHLLGSLEYGHGTYAEATTKETEMRKSDLTGLAEQWLTEPSAANPLAVQPGVPPEPEKGTFAHAYWRAKYAGRTGQ